MDRAGLRLALREAGVADDHYWIEGTHEPAPPPVDFLFLRRGRAGGWETGVYERGSAEVTGCFDTEHAACLHLRELLNGP
ncbi:hypothetical protein LHJ74_25615 [Streptomyces sp. N2-109]|uniref:Uncharacterized protein n=1 Tax=Streptomyces gossypii TaxID=2883101 RepID=A0ABT2JZA6_9ACTN|nr:hypothetical protein [Streptomyces gossypii]MCT2593241.1 hypothetical protein [Streptomyces gossypii]